MRLTTLAFLSIALIINSELFAQNYDEPASAGTSGTDNTSIGTNAGSNGSYNTSMGKAAGDVVTGTYNAFFGMNSGRVVSSASHNTFAGNSSGYSTTTGGYNTFIGRETGYANITGAFNTYLGYQSGYTNTSSSNVFLGAYSGRSSTSGGNNTHVGYYSGYSNSTGSGNVFIGYNAGANELGSNKLYLDNSNTSTPLIFGDFSANQIGINSAPNSTHALTVGGSIHSTGGVFVNGVSVDDWGNSGSNINYTAGIVSIGTTSAPTGYKLAIGGKAVCEEVVVKLQANWPDYVFDNDYELPTLEELQLFIAEHKHLPEIPSANEITEKGLSVGEMNAKLLKKIEELTLYLIAQDNRIKELEKVVKPIEKQ